MLDFASFVHVNGLSVLANGASVHADRASVDQNICLEGKTFYWVGGTTLCKMEVRKSVVRQREADLKGQTLSNEDLILKKESVHRTAFFIKKKVNDILWVVYCRYLIELIISLFKSSMIMAKQYYLPRGDQNRAIWLQNFAAKLSEHAATLTVDAATVTDIQNAAAYYGYVLTIHQALKNNVKEMTSFKNLLSNGRTGQVVGALPTLPTFGEPPTAVSFPIFVRVQQLVNGLRNHTAYTESIGQDLGIIGAEQVVNTAAMKPVLALSIVANEVIVKWTKGKATSIDIYADKGDGKGMVYLANDYSPNYEDRITLTATDPPAVWSYRAIYRIGDKQVGQYSDLVSITVYASI